MVSPSHSIALEAAAMKTFHGPLHTFQDVTAKNNRSMTAVKHLQK